MSEIRLAARPPAGQPATRRRRPAIVISMAGVAALAAAAAIALAVALPSGPGYSPAAVRLLAKVATTAASQPSPQVSDNQFWYIKSWVAYQNCDASNRCVLQKPHERQIWLSVSNLCVAGLLREDGHDDTLAADGSYVRCPWRGVVNDPTYRLLQSLPTDPHALLSLIERQMQGQQPRAEEAFTTIGDLLREAVAPPPISAALYRAAALIPGVTVVQDAADAIGRTGVAVAMTYQGVRSEWIFSKQTLLYLGERDVNVASGSIVGESAVLQRAFVNHAGQLPG